jgi:hypothetical protein
MATLTSLPHEIRQNIFLQLVQQEDQLIGSAYPKTIRTLLQTCNDLRNDMAWVLSQWSPTMWYLTTPFDLPNPPSITIAGTIYTPKFTHICISMLHYIPLGTICNKYHGTIYHSETHPEVEEWSAVVAQLSTRGIKTVYLDITLAPGWMRKGHENSFNSLLLDGQVQKHLQLCYQYKLLRLIQLFHGHYVAAGNDDIEIKLTGVLSNRAKQDIDSVSWRSKYSGIDADFEGTYIDCVERALHKAVRTLAPKVQPARMNKQDWAGCQHLARLRKVRWSRPSWRLFNEACDEAGNEAMYAVLRQMAEYWIIGNCACLEMPPASALRRTVIHNLAKDMGMSAESKGTGDDRRVAIVKWMKLTGDDRRAVITRNGKDKNPPWGKNDAW